MKEQKKQLRKQIASRKALYSIEQRKTLSLRLLEQLERHPRFKAAHTILCYHSLPDEVQTHDFVERWAGKKQLLLPVVVGDELELRIYTGKASMQVGAYGIEEPIGKSFTDYDTIELAIVPGVSFDSKGHRLGRGKGYYDRLLPHLSSYNIGICYAFQISESIPCESFDRRMDAVLTDEGWLSEK